MAANIDQYHDPLNHARAANQGLTIPYVPILTDAQVQAILEHGVNRPLRSYRQFTPGRTSPQRIRSVKRRNRKNNKHRVARNLITFRNNRHIAHPFLLIGRIQDGRRPPGFHAPNNKVKVLRMSLAEWYELSDWFGWDWREEFYTIGQCREAWCAAHGVLRILSDRERTAYVHVPWADAGFFGSHPNRNYNLPPVTLPPVGHPNYEANALALQMPRMIPGWR